MSTWIAGKGTIPSITTNADRIRSMTDEELAEFIEHSPYPPNATCSEEGCKFDTCVECWLDWLKQESEE